MIHVSNIEEQKKPNPKQRGEREREKKRPDSRDYFISDVDGGSGFKKRLHYGDMAINGGLDKCVGPSLGAGMQAVRKGAERFQIGGAYLSKESSGLIIEDMHQLLDWYIKDLAEISKNYNHPFLQVSARKKVCGFYRRKSRHI